MSALGQMQTFTPQKSCPLCPRKRTYAVQQLMSALGQKRTCAVQLMMSASSLLPFHFRADAGPALPTDFKPKRAQRRGTLSKSMSNSYLRRSGPDFVLSGQIARNSRKKSSNPAGEITSINSH